MNFLKIPLLFSLCLLLLSACSSGESNSTNNTSSPTTADPRNDAPPAKEGQIVAKTFRGLEIRPINFPGQTFMGIRAKVPMDRIQSTYGPNMSKVMTACQNAGLRMDGMPSALFYEFNEEAKYIDMAATIAVTAGQAVGGGVEIFTLPNAKALQIDYYGTYQGIANAHYAMDDYMSTYKLLQNRAIPVIEEYITDPGAQPDPSKRLTKVTYFYR